MLGVSTLQRARAFAPNWWVVAEDQRNTQGASFLTCSAMTSYKIGKPAFPVIIRVEWLIAHAKASEL